MDSDHYTSGAQLLQLGIFKQEWDAISEAVNTLMFKKGLQRKTTIACLLGQNLTMSLMKEKFLPWGSKGNIFSISGQSSATGSQLSNPAVFSVILERKGHIIWAPVVSHCSGSPVLHRPTDKKACRSPPLRLNSSYLQHKWAGDGQTLQVGLCSA